MKIHLLMFDTGMSMQVISAHVSHDAARRISEYLNLTMPSARARYFIRSFDVDELAEGIVEPPPPPPCRYEIDTMFKRHSFHGIDELEAWRKLPWYRRWF